MYIFIYIRILQNELITLKRAGLCLNLSTARLLDTIGDSRGNRRFSSNWSIRIYDGNNNVMWHERAYFLRLHDVRTTTSHRIRSIILRISRFRVSTTRFRSLKRFNTNRIGFQFILFVFLGLTTFQSRVVRTRYVVAYNNFAQIRFKILTVLAPIHPFYVLRDGIYFISCVREHRVLFENS